MNEEKRAILSALSYKLGELHDIKTLDDLEPEIQESLIELGLKQYSESELAISEMVRESVKGTLKEASITTKEIDAVVYGTMSFLNRDHYNELEISLVLNDLGLAHAYPFSVSFSWCANLLSLIRIGTSLVKSGDCNNVLLITADATPEWRTRLVPPKVSVSSDAVASCIITSQEVDGFEIVQNTQYSNASTAGIDIPNQEIEYFESTSKGLKIVMENLLKKIDKKPDDFYGF